MTLSLYDSLVNLIYDAPAIRLKDMNADKNIIKKDFRYLDVDKINAIEGIRIFKILNNAKYAITNDSLWTAVDKGKKHKGKIINKEIRYTSNSK